MSGSAKHSTRTVGGRHRRRTGNPDATAVSLTAPANPTNVVSRGLGRYVGRVGALALALGVGVAVATGQGLGVAHADDTSSNSSGSNSSGSNESNASAAKPTESTATDGPAAAASTSDVAAPDAATDAPHASGASAPNPPTMNVSVSGTATIKGANGDDDEVDEDEKPTETKTTEPEPESKPTPTDTVTPPASEPDAHSPSHRDTTSEPASPEVKSSVVHHDPAPQTTAADSKRPVAPAEPAATMALRTATATSTAVVAPSLAVTPPALRPQDPVSALIALPGAILAAVLSPFLNPGPVVPARPPLLIAVLGLVARELQRALFNYTPVARTQDVDLTLQDPDDVSDPIAFDGTDADGDPLVYSVPPRGTTGGPTHGTVTIDQATGTFTYDPDDAFAATGGTDTFTVTVTDAAGQPHLHGLLGLFSLGAQGHTSTATVTIRLAAVNDAPVANDDAVTTNEDTAVTVNVLANDSDPDGDPLTVTPGTGPANGTVTLGAGGVLTYVPNPDFFGTDTFTYTLSDGRRTDTATVTVTVNPTNDPLTAIPDTATVGEDSPVATGNVLTNDRAQNPDGPTETLTVLPVSHLDSAWGRVDIAADGTYTYTPKPNYNGSFTVNYTVSDGLYAAAGTLTITVTPSNDPVDAIDDDVTVEEDSPTVTGNVLDNDRAENPDGPGEVLTVTNPGSTTTALGTLSVSSDGSYTFTPAANQSGVISHSYTVSDGTSTSTATLTVTVTAVDDPITAVPDSATIDEDGGILTGNVLTNDRAQNPDGPTETLTVLPVSHLDSAWGRVDIAADGTYTYTPKPNYNGSFTVNYIVSDGTDTATGTLTITVNPVNDPLTGVDDTLTVAEDSGPVTGKLLDNDRAENPDGPGEQLTITNPGTYTSALGTLSVRRDGEYTFTPAPNANGTHTVSFTVTDGVNQTTTTLTITVTAADDPITAIDDTVTIDEDSPAITGNVLTNDRDRNPDGPTEVLTVTPVTVTNSIFGTITIGADGQYRYTPRPNYNGTINIPYTVTDGTTSSTARLSITVTSINDPVAAIDDTVTIDEDSGPVTGNVLTNDRDRNPDGPGEVLTVTPFTATAATNYISMDADGTFRYTPPPDFFGTATTTYVVTDGTYSATGTLTIAVRPVDDPITAIDDTVTIDEDSPTITGNVLTNDRAQNPDGPTEVLTVTPVTVTNSIFGTITIGADGQYRYTPRPNYNGTINVPYTVTDGTTSSTARLSITVTSINDAPTVPTISPTTLTPNVLSGRVTGTATSTDVEGSPLVFSGSTTTGKGGTVVVNADGTFSYTPSQTARENADPTTTDSFTITVSDGTASTSTTVTVKIAPVNVELGSVSVGQTPNGIALTPDGTRGYVANQGTGSVTVFDTATYTVVKTITLTGAPTAIAMNPTGTYAYVTTQSGNTVAVIDTATNTVAKTITVNGTPLGIAISADGSRVYTANTAGNSVTIIDTADNTPITTFGVGGSARGVAVAPNGSRIYVTLQDKGQVVEVDPVSQQVTKTYSVGTTPNRIVLSPNGTRAYVTNQGSASVTVLNLTTQTVVTTVAVKDSPNVLAISPDGTRVFVTSSATEDLSIIDTATNTVIDTIDVNGLGRGVVINGAGTKLYVSVSPTVGTGAVRGYAIGSLGIGLQGLPVSQSTNAITGRVTGSVVSSEVDPGTLTFTGTATTAKGSVVVNTDGTFVYTPTQSAREAAATQTSTDTFTITAGNGTTNTTKTVVVGIAPVNVVLTEATVGPRPNGIAITPDGSRAYVANQQGNSVVVVDTATNLVVATVTVGSTPTAVVLTPNGTRAYVTSQSGTVAVIDTATNLLVKTITVGTTALGIAVSPNGSRVYVANLGSGTISVIDTASNNVVDTYSSIAPRGIAVSADGTKLYVTDSSNGRVYVRDSTTGALLQTITGVGSTANRIVVSPDGTRGYVTDAGGTTVSAVNLTSGAVVGYLSVGQMGNVLVLSPDGSRLYVTNAEDTVKVFDTATNTLVGTIDVGSSSRGAAISPDGTLLYVTSSPSTNSTNGTVSAIPIGALGGVPTSA